MGPEVNIESIRELERQIEEAKRRIVKLKRARNSLLNISTRVPPEILGDIFSWTLARGDPISSRDSHFDGFPKGSYNFLLVCHHWSDVASHTPKLWNFWGNTMEEWRTWHHRHPQVTPLDLVLDGDVSHNATFIPTDDTLIDTLRDRATRDTIRQVHLSGCDGGPLSSIISLLTPDEGVQHRSIESIDLQNLGPDLLNVSYFLSRIHLPKLRSCVLRGALLLPPWDHLAQRTTLLTTLSLLVDHTTRSSPSTIPQLFSVLVSNPGLQRLSLSGSAVPQHDGGGSIPQVALRHLKNLDLCGELRCVFGVLGQLSFPRPLDSIKIITVDCTVEVVSQAFMPYIQFYFRLDRGLGDRLEIGAYSFHGVVLTTVNTKDEGGSPGPFSAMFQACVFAPEKAGQNLCNDFLTSTPRESACRFDTNLPLNQLEEQFITMPNIETLNLSNVVLSQDFLQPNPGSRYASTKLLPSLRSLCLRDLTLGDDGWRPLATYLGDRTSDGEAISLAIEGRGPHMCPEVVKQIENVVRKFSCGATLETECPMGRCEEESESELETTSEV